MRQLNLMRPTAPTAATVSNVLPSRATAAALPAPFGGGAGAGGFSATFRQVQNDVAHFIEQGGPAAPAQAGTELGVEAQALRQRAAGVIDNTTQGDPEVQRQFLASIQPWAEETAGRLGVAPHVVAAHAALESGWGQRPLRQGTADSNNLFGLKAGADWRGAVASATTTEFEHGAALRKVERFRSYPDTAAAFRDYADLLSNNPRYQGALHTGADARAFANGLSRGGYASDPAYADKLSRLAEQLQRGASAPQSGD
jgi:flagellar protein FlgJ